MTDSELIQSVNQIFTDSFEIPPERLTPQAEIFADLGLDSLDMVDLIAAIQKKFNTHVKPDQRVMSIRTLQDLYDYLKFVHPST
jgi:acyl carrier protein